MLRAWALAALPALVAAGCGGEQGESRPSFVLILADDLGWADVGFQGSRFHRTPALDELARTGLVFTQAYAAAPVCSPSRAALVTGLSPARLHMTSVLGTRTPVEDVEERMEAAEAGDLVEPAVRDRLPPVATLGTLLRGAGYRTGWIGKWHCGPGIEEAGFDVRIAATTLGLPHGYFSPYGIEGFPDGPEGEYLTDRLTDEAVRFLEESREQPFLLVLAHHAPHVPLEAPRELVAECAARADAADPQHNPLYAAMIERLDASVGRVRETLERLDLDERTLLVFTSDNGAITELTGAKRARRRGVEEGEPYAITSNAPLRSGKGRLYEGGIRVPFVAWGGPVARAGKCDAPIIGMDLLPTLAALAGVAAPETCDGVDLSPLLLDQDRGTGGDALARTGLYFHFPHQSFASAVRHGDEKLVYSWSDEKSELFDLALDPGEQHDLAPERPERVAELEGELFRWLDETKADRPVRREAVPNGR